MTTVTQHHTTTTPLRFSLPATPLTRVLHQIRTGAPISRGGIRKSLGYSQPSVTRQVNALIDADWVEQLPAPVRDSVSAGRPSKDLELNARHVVVWGVHIGARNSVLVICDGAGRILREESLDVAVHRSTPQDFLDYIAGRMQALSQGLPTPHSVGVAFSEPLGMMVCSALTYTAGRKFRQRTCLAMPSATPYPSPPVYAAMAATEMLSHPLNTETAGPALDSTMNIYGREVVTHAWMFNGAVHRPHSGKPDFDFAGLLDSDSKLLAAASEHDHAHALSNSTVLYAAKQLGIEAESFRELIARSGSEPQVRDLLSERASALSAAIRLAVDLVDPVSVVFAGEAFTDDPASIKEIVGQLRSHSSHPKLRIQRAGNRVLHNAARMSALYPLWNNPLA
ncbi:ROK family transcriptional regulator [Corynebacterium camporealensis]|uniref:ROK family transcriptional regulator n=1 Tax=Corynebacterium camporealensis TaxID=161896 RepID=UPI00131A20A4|nr:helix-turn-helix domain-containing protein [Corynebacterium camporealensis]